jgi:hypothetical protein
VQNLGAVNEIAQHFGHENLVKTKLMKKWKKSMDKAFYTLLKF